MKQTLLFAALILISATASADVYRCKTDAGVVYSEQPCAGGSNTEVKNVAPPPTEEDARAAQSRSVSDQKQAEAINREEEAARTRRAYAASAATWQTRSTTTTTTTTIYGTPYVTYPSTGTVPGQTRYSASPTPQASARAAPRSIPAGH